MSQEDQEGVVFEVEGKPCKESVYTGCELKFFFQRGGRIDRLYLILLID